MKRVQFESKFLPYLFLLPQLCIVVVFFYWPAAQAIRSSFFIEDPFGFGSTFAGPFQLHRYARLIRIPAHRALYSVFQRDRHLLVLAIGLTLAVKADAVIRANPPTRPF